ncbi:MAG: hypothetical protein EA361_07940 [Bacteroidetes bacterium]|nr:MAG: hypothetical protein EA361_07940 [Bacteroidota bacterium]
MFFIKLAAIVIVLRFIIKHTIEVFHAFFPWFKITKIEADKHYIVKIDWFPFHFQQVVFKSAPWLKAEKPVIHPFLGLE